MEDRQLLRRFVEQNSQEAFAALTARYLNLVYSVCRREMADADAAEDVTQAVFLILARKAPTLRQGVILSGWLFQTARFAAKNARLQTQRRAAYEQKAAEAMQQQSGEREDAAWAEIEPILNASLAALREGERQCVLLRFFQGLSFAEAGAALDLSEEAARKRVTRALEKMHHFFTKEGIVIPGVALAALLSSHAAKAAPITFQAVLAHIENTVLAGQVPMGLTGSHGYQLAEGVTQAMKITQIKVAVGLSAAVLIGLTTYTVAREIALAATTSDKAAPVLPTNLKPGHVLVQPVGSILTAPQIIEHCQKAYSALQTFQCTTEVTEQSVTAEGRAGEHHCTSAIKFVRPGRIKVALTDASGNSFAYVSDGAATMQKNPLTHGDWTKAENTEMAIGTVRGIDADAASTIPALLLGLGTHSGNPFTSGDDPEVREDDVDGQPCYVVTSYLIVAMSAQRAAFWVDEKTFLLRRYVLDANNAATYFMLDGKRQNVPATKLHKDQRITNEIINAPLPDTTFALPAGQ